MCNKLGIDYKEYDDCSREMADMVSQGMERLAQLLHTTPASIKEIEAYSSESEMESAHAANSSTSEEEAKRGRLLVVRRRPLFASPPFVLESAACALSISDSLKYASLSLMDAGGVCTNCANLYIPWITMSAISPGAFAFLRSRSSSTTAIALFISLSKVEVWAWLYLYCLFMSR